MFPKCRNIAATQEAPIPPLPRKDLSLKSLELFQLCARKGTLQAVSEETALSVSTISHHLRTLEQHLGVDLFNHARRPMVLTAKGRDFLHNIEDPLRAIRRATAEASAGDITEASYLRIGTIEDFDSDIFPQLAVLLSRTMPRCRFLHHTDTSNAIIGMLGDRKLDLGITGSPPGRIGDLRDVPLVQDPFVIVLPRGSDIAPEDALHGKTSLPMLRFSGNLMIARQIETQLKRSALAVPDKFECDNNQTIMAMVAAGAGWAISTPLLFARAGQFQSRVRMHRFPGKSFSRTLSVVATPDCSRAVLELVYTTMRELVTEHAIAPFHDAEPWLKDSFHLAEVPPIE